MAKSNGIDKSNGASASAAKVVHLRKVQRGDLVEVVRQLRRLLAACDTTALTLYASFDDIDSALEESAVKARRNVEGAAARIYQLLTVLEHNETYMSLRQDALDRASKDELNGY